MDFLENDDPVNNANYKVLDKIKNKNVGNEKQRLIEKDLILNLSNDIIDEDSKEYENSLRSIGRMTLTTKCGYSTFNTQSSKFKKSGEKINPLEAWRNINIYTIIPENKIKNKNLGK